LGDRLYSKLKLREKGRRNFLRGAGRGKIKKTDPTQGKAQLAMGEPDGLLGSVGDEEASSLPGRGTFHLFGKRDGNDPTKRRGKTAGKDGIMKSLVPPSDERQ